MPLPQPEGVILQGALWHVCGPDAGMAPAARTGRHQARGHVLRCQEPNARLGGWPSCVHERDEAQCAVAARSPKAGAGAVQQGAATFFINPM
eukprot:3690705-Prymnesium_polylepis.2